MTFVLTVASTAPADTIALYEFGSGSTGSLASTDTDANSTASSFSDGPSFIGGTSFVGSGSPRPSRGVFTDHTATSQPDALSTGSYFSFTINPDAGYTLNLSSLTFETSASSTIENYFVRSSVDGYGSDLTSFLHSQGTTFVPRSANVSGSEFDNLTTSTEFRIFIYDSSNTSSATARVDNVTLSGTVEPVPEPGTVALMLIGLTGLGLSAQQRKKKQAAVAQAQV